MIIYDTTNERSLLDAGFDTSLLKSLPTAADSVLYVTPAALNSFLQGITPQSLQSGELAGDISSVGFVSGSEGWKIYSNGDVEFNNGVFRGALSASTIDIGGADSTSFHVDIDGNMWSGAAAFASAPFKVSSTGVLTVGVTNVTIDGPNKRILINDGSNDRILLGYQSGGF